MRLSTAPLVISALLALSACGRSSAPPANDMAVENEIGLSDQDTDVSPDSLTAPDDAAANLADPALNER